MNTIDRVHFSSSEFEPYFEYWKQYVPEYRDEFALRQLNLHAAGDEGRMATLRFGIDSQVLQPVRQLVKDNDTGMFTSLLSVCGILLHRYTLREHVTVHSPSYKIGAGDTFYADTIPLLLHVRPDVIVRDYLVKVRNMIRGCYYYQNFPVHLADPTPGEPPFASNVLVSYEPIHGPLPGSSRYDLVLSFERVGDAIEAEVRYNVDAFDPAFMSHMGGHFIQAFSHITALNTPIGDIPLLTRPEALALARFNLTETPFPGDTTVQELFEQQAAKTPDEVAVVYRSTTLTYRQLNESANQLAHSLRETYGVQTGDVVGLMARRSEELVIGLLGILKAGATLLPIDAANPADRKKYMIADASVKVLLTGSDALFEVDYFTGGLFALDVQLTALDTSRENPAADYADIAYVLYTSGSTGKPKGVQVPARSLTNYVVWANGRYCNHEKGHTFALFTSLSFDLTLTSLFSPLLRGDKLVVLPDKQLDDLLWDLFYHKTEVNAVKLTPSHVSALGYLPIGRTNVDRVIVGGEALTAEHVRTLQALNPDMRIYNEYGPTETTVGCTVQEITDAAARITIGKPIANACIYILDAHLNQQPVGIPGEICIGGVGVAAGYLNQPELTAAKFLDNPYYPGQRLYRSGDQGRWLPDGTIEYLGRQDEQTKIRGFRVEPREIEQVIRQHPGVGDVFIHVGGDKPDEKSLTAILTPADATAFTLRQRLRVKEESPELHKSLVTLPNGMVVFHNNKSEMDLIYDEIFRDHTYCRNGISLGSDAVVFDVGANIGMFSLYAGLHFPGVKVFAFEPMLPVYEKLKANIALYNVNVTAFHCGLSDTEQTVPFTYYPNNTVLSGRYGSLAHERDTVGKYLVNDAAGKDIALSPQMIGQLLDERISTQRLDCKIRRISDVIRENQVERIDLLKIDAEKSEWDVLMGLEAEDWPKVRQIIIEVHDTDGRLAQIEGLLHAQGFETFTNQDDVLAGTDIFNVYATRTPAVIRTAPAPPASPQFNRQTNWNSTDELVKSLKAHCVATLPPYMVPAEFKVVYRVPLTANGKLDQKAVVQLVGRELDSAQPCIEPRNALEEKLVAIWKKVLNKDKIGINSDFIELGGHSLKAVQVVSRVYEELEAKIELRDIFANPTVEGLAGIIGNARHTAYQSIGPIPDGEHYEVSHAQKRMWVLDQFEEGQTAYNSPALYVFHGALLPDVLRQTLDVVMARHETLRTTFITVAGEPRQRVHPPGGLDQQLRCLDLRDREGDLERLARSMADAEIRTPFNLAEGPLFRTLLLQFSDDKYLFVINMHHIVSDGWSKGVLIREVIQLYNAFSRGEENPLLPLSIQYRDFAAWQNDLLREESIRKHRDYWLGQFSGEVPVLHLPADHPRPVMQTYNGASVSYWLDAKTTRGLQNLGKRHGASMFMVLTAAVKALLYKYTGQNDVTVGTPIAGRDHNDLEAQVGLYVNTLALRTRFEAAEPFDDLLRKVINTTLSAYEHNVYPFDRLVDDLYLARDTSRSPLFDVMLVLQNAQLDDKGEAEMAGVLTGSYATNLSASQFDLSFVFAESGDCLRATIEYNTDLFSPERVERMPGHCQELFAAITRDSATPLCRLAYIPKAEAEQLLTAFNDTALAVPADKDFNDLFEEQVRKTPDAAAVASNGVSLTYAELNARANQLTYYLREACGTKPGDLVGVMLQRSEGVIVAVLGILKAGAAYVPIDPEYPADRIHFMIQDSGVRVLLTDQPLPPGGGSPDVVVLPAAEAFAASAGFATDNPARKGNARDLAYVIYTSGSSGRPKGVMVEHRNVVNIAHSWRRQYGLDTLEVRLLQMASISFDVFFGDICRSLLNGGCLVMCPSALRTDPEGLFQLISDNRISVLEATPALVMPLMEYVYIRRADISCLKLLILGSDVCPVKEYKRLLRRFGNGMRIINSYGTTETTIDSSFYEEPAAGVPDRGALPIGKPMGNTQFYILDADQSLLPVGIAGELYIGGAGVSRGYLNADDLTRGKFVPSPFEEGVRLYRTGDVARWHADGNAEFLGRNDKQVKLRGYRIELNEIEHMLLGHAAVKDALVLVKEDKKGNKQLVAYLVTDGQPLPNLTEYLLDLLPTYMIPTYFVPLESFPLTPNSKVDHQALPTPERLLLSTGSESVAPRNDVEALLHAMWKDILGKEAISIHDNFFELGGQSLKAAQLIARLLAEKQLKITLRNIFLHPTLEALARIVEGLLAPPPAGPPAP